jgi:hypothetical protein
MINLLTPGALEPNTRCAVKPSSNYRNFAKYIIIKSQRVMMKEESFILLVIKL